MASITLNNEISGVYYNGTLVKGVYLNGVLVCGEYTIIFNGNGGTPSSQTMTTVGGKISSLPTVSKTGYTFLGWYTSLSGGTQVTTSTVFTSNTTVYALWSEETSGDGPSGDYTAYTGAIYIMQNDSEFSHTICLYHEGNEVLIYGNWVDTDGNTVTKIWGNLTGEVLEPAVVTATDSPVGGTTIRLSDLVPLNAGDSIIVYFNGTLWISPYHIYGDEFDGETNLGKQAELMGFDLTEIGGGTEAVEYGIFGPSVEIIDGNVHTTDELPWITMGNNL